MERTGHLHILIANHRALVRSALRTFLWAQPGLDVVGEASDSQELLSQLESTRPNLLILDWELPGQSAADLLAALSTRDGRFQIIVLGNSRELQPDVLAAGADCYVSKNEPPRRLLAAIRAMQVQAACAC
jgi:DNA-binding NarL/FixJ family response regulator